MKQNIARKLCSGLRLCVGTAASAFQKETREKELLLDKDWPFDGEGVTVKQEDGPPPKR